MDDTSERYQLYDQISKLKNQLALLQGEVEAFRKQAKEVITHVKETGESV